ncbi:MAG: DUF4271 domain-containing protein [Flavobacteriaceae bacterium]|jgi:hypothetical protein|nr:hypothetical protein [Flavobacteriaceae bacterium]MAW16252.1 hypothetical protein [Flavobacteriaceae bacterium]|tara:strand:+ start:4168 stop:4809 length:642 start_codon:yes stop_codon:yes gene_type:complete
MYELRELGDHYFGLCLILTLTILAALKLLNPWRLNSLMHFWIGVRYTEVFNKTFKLNRAFSILTFVFRSLVFGVVLSIFKDKSFYISSFDGKVLYYACGFMIFWIIRTFIESIIILFFNKQEEFFRIIHIRTLNKEKTAFFYSCLINSLAFIGLGKISSIIIASSYAIAVFVIHLNMIKLYFKHLNVMPVYIILYICTSEIAPLWIVLHVLKF